MMRQHDKVSTSTHTRFSLTHQLALPSSSQPYSLNGHASLTFVLDDSSLPATHTDVTSVSGTRMIKHRRTPGSSSDPYMPFKRVLQSDVIQDSGSDVIGRPPKMKVAKSKSDKGGVDFSSPKYASLASYGKIPKRSKAKNDKGEKLLVSKLPRSDDRLLLERRSRTFVVESHERLLDEGHQRTRTKELRISNVPSKLETFTNRKPPKPPVSKDSSQHTPSSKEHVSNRTVAHEELTSKGTNQWQERRGESRINQWEVETEALREGARNPMNSGSYLPARPKSAGQLRYYDSDDSDESSLGGEIEIVGEY